MNWLTLQTVAQVSVERVLNVLPEGLLIALFAWTLLRLSRRQNSGTRFAVWFLALIAVASLPFMPELGDGHARIISANSWAIAHTVIAIPEGWAAVIFLLWTLGACAAITRLAVGLWQVRQLRRSCTPIAADDLDPAIQKTVAAITEGRKVTVATSDSVSVPAAIGFWKQTIILPSWTLRELPTSDLNAILLHEFAHLRRGDDWTNLIQKVVRAVFFFHPAVWWIERQLSVEREMACDDAVLAETANPHGYATCLVSLLEKSLAHRGWSMAQAAVHRAHEASLRLAKILDKNRPGATRVWKPAVGMVGAFVVVSLVALPHAPQFVAVDHGFDQNAIASPAVVNSASLVPTAFPASHQTAAAILVAQHEKSRTRVRSHATGAQQPLPVQSATQTNAATLPFDMIATNANLDEQFVPQFQTLVFIEATPYGNFAVPLWRVQIWRVTMLTGMRERIAQVPVANSI